VKIPQAFALGLGKDTKMKRPSLLSQLDAGFGSSPLTLTIQAGNAGGSNCVKPEPNEPVIPRKRPSDIGLSDGTVKAEAFPLDIVDPSSTPSASKKIKAEAHKTPLALANRNLASSNQVQASAPGLSVTEATVQLNEIQRKLTKAEIDFNKLTRKPRKTKAEMTKFGMLSREIDRLQARKNDYAAIISPLAPVAQQVSKHEPIPAALVPSLVVSPLPAPLPPAFSHPAFFTIGEQKPAIHQPQPIASGSNVRLADVHLAYREVKTDTDDDDGMSTDGAELLDELFPARTATAVGGYGENFDDDGNFHGRGRDKFVGPQAKADEYAAFRPCNGAHH
jgi:hypothetical protein